MSLLEESKWSQLPDDILSVIANKLNNNDKCNTLIHNLRLRSVCNSWRSSIILSPSRCSLTVGLTFRLAESTVYLLQHQATPSSSSRYSLLRVKNTISNKRRVLDPLFRIHLFRFCLSRYPKSINLLDVRIFPIKTLHTLHFVDASKSPTFSGFGFRNFNPRKVAISSHYGRSHSLTIMAIFGMQLYVLEFGDNKWREVKVLGKILDIIFHKNCFYAVDIDRMVYSVSLSDLKVESFLGCCCGYKTFVESNDALYLIVKCFKVDELCVHTQLKIYKLNEEDKKLERVYDLDNHVFFVGDSFAYSISVRDFPGLESNCVYFLNDSFIDANKKLEEFCRDIGVYKLDDGSCGPLINFPDHLSLF